MAKSKAVEALRSKIETYLRQKQWGYEVKPNGSLLLRQGSTAVSIMPAQWNEQTVVRLTAPVTMELKEITPELTRFLAEENNKLLFGKFSLDTDNNIVWYEHTLLGDFLDAEELFTAVAAIVVTADEYDELVSKMARGKRVIDM